MPKTTKAKFPIAMLFREGDYLVMKDGHGADLPARRIMANAQNILIPEDAPTEEEYQKYCEENLGGEPRA